MAASSASTARCTSPTIRSTTRSSTSRPAIWVSAFDTRFGRVGTLVCWDQWYPEGARLTALQGAEVLFYPTAIGWHPAEKEEFGAAQHDAWQTIQRAHAIANGVYVAGVESCRSREWRHPGQSRHRPGLEFWGGSFLADPFGRIIAKASHDEEEILIGEIDLALIEDTRRNWPFLRDRRIDAYAPITSAFSIRVPAQRRKSASSHGDGSASRGRTRRANWAIACPPNGSRTRPPGWHGRTIPKTGPANSRPSPGSTLKSSACSPLASAFNMLVQDEKEQRRATSILERGQANLDNVIFHQWPTDRGWTRDSGPIFVRNAEGRISHHQLALQRLGQVCRLASRRPGSRPRR